MPSDKRNSIAPNAMGLSFLLFDVASSLDEPFGTLKYIHIINSLWTYVPGPFFVSHSSSRVRTIVDQKKY